MWIDQRGSEILGDTECLRLLALEAKDHGVGRLAVSRSDAPIIQPVNFSYHSGLILVRLGDGFMVAVAKDALVAFEVDRLEHHASLAWSVLVRGLATVLTEDEGEALARLAPRPLVPVPGLQVLSIRPDVVTGRRFPLAEEFATVSPRGPTSPPHP